MYVSLISYVLIFCFCSCAEIVFASLILQYATFGHPKNSLFLFQKALSFSPTAFLWNTLIRAYSIAGLFGGFSIYNAMVRSGVKPDDHTYPFILKGCSDYFEIDKGREVHGVVFKFGFDKDVFVGNTLLMLYGNCGFFVDAIKVFDEMFERDKVSWNTVIGLCSVQGFYQGSLCFFKEMVANAPVIRPDLVTVVSVLPVCADSENVVMARIVHGYGLKDFNAKLSDLGLARDGPTGDNTHVSTRVIGTQGYAAPEYVATGHLTPRSDVYSFGVVLLELPTGKRAVEDTRPGLSEETLVDWAMPFLSDTRRVLRIMDTRLGGQYSKKGAQAAAALALQCLNSDPKFRPPMVDAVATLEGLQSSNTFQRTPKYGNHTPSTKHSSHSLS